MVLAAGLERDVAQDHDVVIAADLPEGPLQDLGRVLLVALEPFRVGPRHAGRRIGEPLPVRILPGPADQGANRLLGRLAARALPNLLLDLNLRKRPVHLSLQTASSGIG